MERPRLRNIFTDSEKRYEVALARRDSALIIKSISPRGEVTSILYLHPDEIAALTAYSAETGVGAHNKFLQRLNWALYCFGQHFDIPHNVRLPFVPIPKNNQKDRARRRKSKRKETIVEIPLEVGTEQLTQAYERALQKPLLDPWEEIVCTRIVAYASSSQAISRQRALELLVDRNSRLVFSIAQKYICPGIPFNDLKQVGNEGLLRAIKKFEPIRGNRLSTYATWWIRQAVQRYADEHRGGMRMPAHAAGWQRDCQNLIESLTQKLSREPTEAEILVHPKAIAMHLTSRKLHDLLNASQVDHLERQKDGDDGERTPLSRLADHAALPEEEAERALIKEAIEAALEVLTPREQMIIRLRFGLRDGHCHTLEQIAQKIGVTRERIRQIEAQALRKLQPSFIEFAR